MSRSHIKTIKGRESVRCDSSQTGRTMRSNQPSSHFPHRKFRFLLSYRARPVMQSSLPFHIFFAFLFQFGENIIPFCAVPTYLHATPTKIKTKKTKTQQRYQVHSNLLNCSLVSFSLWVSNRVLFFLYLSSLCLYLLLSLYLSVPLSLSPSLCVPLSRGKCTMDREMNFPFSWKPRVIEGSLDAC